jgi:hypothetical protein
MRVYESRFAAAQLLRSRAAITCPNAANGGRRVPLFLERLYVVRSNHSKFYFILFLLLQFSS